MEVSVSGDTRTTTIFFTIGTTHVATKTTIGSNGTPTIGRGRSDHPPHTKFLTDQVFDFWVKQR